MSKQKQTKEQATQAENGSTVLTLGTTMKVVEMDKSGLDNADNQHADDYPFADEISYNNWWNQFRASWLQSHKMTEEEIRVKADDAWECGDYKEVIYLMAEQICRLEKKVN